MSIVATAHLEPTSTPPRSKRTTAERIAYLYAAASVFLGPLIAFGLGGHRSGFDCTDGSWGDLPMADRHAIYVDLKARVMPATIFMVIVGGLVLVWLARSHRGWRSVPAALLCVFMLCGYGFILLMATAFGMWSCL